MTKKPSRMVDAAELRGVNFTDEGYIEVEALSVRTGIQMYHSSELGIGDEGDSFDVAVWRPEEEVFAIDSVSSFARKPITFGHPPVLVDANNWAAYAVGDTDGEVLREGERLRIPMTIRKGSAVQSVKDGIRELSAGYTCDLEWTSGVTPSGEHYDAIQRNIRANHVAIVPRGRAGEGIRIGDSAGKWGAAPITVSDKKEDYMSNALKTVVLGDTAVNVPVADAAIIDAWKAAQVKALADAQTKFDKDMATKDAELVKAQTELADTKKLIPTADALSKMVADRAALLDTAKKLSPKIDFTKMSDAEIRKAVVVDRRGAEMADKSEAYIDASFDILAADASASKPVVDGLHTALNDQRLKADDSDPREAYRKMLADGWKTPTQKEA